MRAHICNKQPDPIKRISAAEVVAMLCGCEGELHYSDSFIFDEFEDEVEKNGDNKNEHSKFHCN